MSKPALTLLLSATCLSMLGCVSTSDNKEFTHAYNLLPTESYMSGEDKCKQELQDIAKEDMGLDTFEVLKERSAMKVDMKTGKSKVECSMIVAPPDSEFD